MKLREINKKEFFDFCKEQPTNNLFQSKEYAEFSRKLGWHTYFLGVDQNGKIRAATMLMSRKFKYSKSRVFYAPRGYIINFKDLELLRFFTKEIKNFIEERNGAFLRIDPYFPLKQLDNERNYIPGGFDNEKVTELLKVLGYQENPGVQTSPNILYRLSLNEKSIDELFHGLDPIYQQILHDNEEKAITCKEVNEEKIPLVLSLFESSNNKMNYFKKLSSLADFYSIFKDEHKIKIYSVEMDIDLYLKNLKEKENQLDIVEEKEVEAIKKELQFIQELQYQYGHTVVMGYNVSVYYGEEVTTLASVINDKFMNFHPLHTLIWESIKDAKQNQFSIYNFYGMNDHTNAEEQLEKIYQGFDDEVIELVGEFDLIINPFIYKHYDHYAKKHQLKITDF